MDLFKKLHIIIALIITILIITANCNKGIQYPKGEIAPDDPVQVNIDNQDSIIIKDYVIYPLAKFEIKAKLLSKKKYYFDKFADLIPVDFALGWGPMSDNSILEHLTIFQSSRWFFWNSKKLPIPKQEIIAHAANMHLIPATKKIKRLLKRTREGKLIRIKGFLVKAISDDGFTWESSLSREDSGSAACELILVNEYEVIKNDE